MSSVKQDDVIGWLRFHLKRLGHKPTGPGGRDNRGPDLIWDSPEGDKVHVEAIGFSDRTKTGTSKRGKNQSDFWKAFSQAIARLNPESEWGAADRVAIAVPAEFLAGWRARVMLHGQNVWRQLGKAFPELEVWFVSKADLKQYRWNEAFSAGL